MAIWATEGARARIRGRGHSPRARPTTSRRRGPRIREAPMCRVLAPRPLIEERIGWSLRRQTGRPRCQAHRGGLAGDTHAAREVPNGSHRPSRIRDRGPSRPWEPGTRCVCEIGVLLARPRTRVLRSGVTASEPKRDLACLGLFRLRAAKASSARLLVSHPPALLLFCVMCVASTDFDR